VTITGTGLSSTTSVRPEFNPEKFLEVVAPKLQLVEQELRSHFAASKIATIRDVGDHILGGGGKRLRPTLLLLVSDMLGYDGKKDVVYGAVVEFIHTATLVHDDVIDESDVRRGRASINYRSGNQLAVLSGDFLYMHAMEMALHEGDLNVLKLLSRVTIEMIEGEILGLETNGRADLTVEEYFDIVGRKTAGLFGATCRIPGYLVALPDSRAQKLFDFGYNLGVGFQLIDDLLDFTSSTEILGKPALSDLKEGKVTLPLILALPRMSARERDLIARVAGAKEMQGSDPAEVLSIVDRYRSVEETRTIAREYIERAHQSLLEFPDSESRAALISALEFVVARDR
jgi:octaprenyl-diphosphate synthase